MSITSETHVFLPGRAISKVARPATGRAQKLTLFALALGSFSIGTSEFASMGIIQSFSDSLGISVPAAANAITAYAFGVVIGAPWRSEGSRRR